MSSSTPPTLPLIENRRLADALDRAGIALMIRNRQTEIIYINQACLSLLGRTLEDTLGVTSADPRWDVILPNGKRFDAEERTVSTALRTAAPVENVVMGIMRTDGKRVWVIANATPVLDDNGKVELILLTLTDITKQHARAGLLAETRAELQKAIDERGEELTKTELQLINAVDQREAAFAALERSENLYAAVVGALSEGIAIHEPSGAIRACNSAAEQILGLTKAQMAGREAVDPRWMLVDEHGDPLPPEKIPSEITRMSGKPCRDVMMGVVRPRKRLDDEPPPSDEPSVERAWLRVSTSPIGEAKQTPVAVVASFVDVTERRAADIALTRSRARFEQVLEASPGVIYQLQLRPSAELLFVSARVAELFGVTDTEAMSDIDALTSVIHPDDRLRALAPARDDTPRPTWEYEFRVRPVGKPERWLRSRAVAQRIAGSTVWTGVILDVTEQRGLAEQLRHAQRLEAIGDLSAGVAHNFNNVLAAILPNLEELTAKSPPHLRTVAEDALVAAKGAADLVRQMLMTTRREPATQLETVAVADVCRDVVSLCRRSFPSRITMALHAPEEPLFVQARASELHQILLNLCINARDALENRPRPCIELEVTLIESSGSKSRERIEIAVRDSGAGMPEDVRQRIGEPFFTTKPPGKGTGLGLATAFGIVRDMGGTLECESEVDQGTTFYLRMKRAHPHETEPPLGTKTPPGRLIIERRALIVEDDNLVRRSLARQLKRRGLSVIEATDGLEGMATFRANPDIDYVILDLSMPGASGEDVLASIRTADPHVPVIVITGFVPESSALGEANAVLLKPVEIEALMTVLERIDAQRT